MVDHPAEPKKRPPITGEIAGNRLQLIESGEDRLRTLIELIAGAERCVKMLMYMFNADAAGTAVRDALAAAARRGVYVRLMIDGFGSSAASDFFKPLEDAAAEHCVFN